MSKYNSRDCSATEVLCQATMAVKYVPTIEKTGQDPIKMHTKQIRISSMKYINIRERKKNLAGKNGRQGSRVQANLKIQPQRLRHGTQGDNSDAEALEVT